MLALALRCNSLPAVLAGQDAGQDAVGGDDLEELGVDAEGDALPGEVGPGR
jgi:hypothetical protein